MLDEDVVLKFSRYTNERILIANTFLMAIVPAIFNGGNSTLAMCIVFSLGIVAPINVISYPSIWIDAPEFTRTKYFAAILPVIILFVLGLYRLSIPALGELKIEDETFNFIANNAGISAAFIDPLTSAAELIMIFAAVAVGASIYFVTQSRFIVQALISACGIGAVVLAFCGCVSAISDYLNIPAILGFFTEKSFATFEYAQDYAAFAFLWSSAIFAVAIYTPQRFRILNFFLSIRTVFLICALFVAATAIYSGSPILKIFATFEIAVAFAVFAINSFPSEKNLKFHWKSVNNSPMPKRKLSEIILPFVIYTLLGVLSISLCAKYSLELNEDYKSAQSIQTLEKSVDADALALIKERPLLGWGASSFTTIFALNQSDDIAMQQNASPSSDYLRARFCYGILGVVLIAIAPILIWLKVIIRNGLSPSGIIFLSSLALMVAYSYFSTPFLSVSVLISFWIIFFAYLAWEDAEII